MKDGKIDLKSVGITIALAFAGVCVGLYDFVSQKSSIMSFITEFTNVQPSLSGSNELWASSLGVGGVIVCIFFVAVAMFSLRSMA